MLRQFKFGIGIELADGTKMNITTGSLLATRNRKTELDIPENRNTDRPVGRQVLQVLHDDSALVLVVLGSPVVIQVIQDLNATVKLIENIAEKTSLS